VTETRTIILGDDGRHVTIGRHSEPSEAEVATAGAALAAQGMGGWLCTLTGTYYGKRKVTLACIREVAVPRHDFAAAEAAFHAARKGATA
jgi:hypothetical protein